jgi:hypothetical protein
MRLAEKLDWKGLMKLEFSRRSFEKYSNIKFHKNPPIGTRVIPWGRTDQQTDMTNMRVDFRNFANTPKTENNTEITAVRK